MSTNPKICINARVAAPKQKVWDCYTRAEHITQWNFADPSWHCPNASNDMRPGGLYHARMEARDGSFGFDFDAVYTEISPGEHFTYEFGGRFATVSFKALQDETEVTIIFDPETENSIELQQQGWQSILNNFKHYTETSL